VLTTTTPEQLFHPAVRPLLEQITGRPGDGLRVAIAAPGGYGKSAVLGALERCYRDAGVDVVDAATLLSGGANPDAAVLIDDAHQLSESALHRLGDLAAGGLPRLVLTHRTRPRSATLKTLTESMEPVLLSPLDAAQVRRFTAALTGESPSTAIAAKLHLRTGGVPRFIERLITGTARASQEFRADLEALDPDVLRFLVASEAGAGRNLDLLCSLLDTDRAGVSAIIDDARATGMLGTDGELVPLAEEAVRTLSAVDRRLDVLQQLVELQLRHEQPVLELATSLLGTGIAGVMVAAGFETAAYEALPLDATLASTLFEAAAEAGRPAGELASGWARAAALSGDLDTALRLSDGLLTRDDPAERAVGATVAATVLAHRGELTRCAELYQWSADGSSLAFAAIGLFGTGKAESARALLAAPAPRAVPTLLAGAATRMAEGVGDSVSGSATDALSTLLGAAAMLEPAGTSALLPDAPAALAAIVALHSGELRLAESVLTPALAAGTGGKLLAVRQRLLLGWTAMTAGELGIAASQAQVVRETTAKLEPRDELFLTAMELGLARRNSDIPGIRRAWENAFDAVMRHRMNLFTLLPLGELVIAAARCGEHPRLSRHLEQARTLLAELGNPPLWTVSLHWSELHAAITMEDNAAAERHLAALAGTADFSHYSAILFGAARSWLAVLGGTADPQEVVATAGELHDLGLRWDAARLAGQAAIRTSDRKAMVMLLEAARQFQGRSNSGNTGNAESANAAADASILSEREQEVARLVVDGLTYKQAGDKLFISGKTVEHHMARIRAKLGAGDRRELLATLRELLDAPNRVEG
jgi:DNA-binding CsgD family transcriptional regulator